MKPGLSLTRLRWRRRFRSLLALILLGGLAFAAWIWLPAPVATVPLVQVIDGDSLTARQEGATLTIRLTGLDAVEYRQDCGSAATRWPLHCELAAKDHDGRTLAACRTAPFPDGIDLGAEMVRSGWAVSTSDAYLPEEGEAQAKRRSIWRGDFIRPADWRATHERPATALMPPDA